jgi:hypothetical protein
MLGYLLVFLFVLFFQPDGPYFTLSFTTGIYFSLREDVRCLFFVGMPKYKAVGIQ